MEGLLDEQTLPTSTAEMDYGIVKFNSWSALRYLSRGRRLMVAGGEIQDIIDLLMRDLDLEVHRKKGWLSDNFAPYCPQDYRGVVQDMLANAGKSQKKLAAIPRIALMATSLCGLNQPSN